MKDSETLNVRIDELEIRLVHQDKVIDELNEALSRQWQAIDELTRKLGALSGRMQVVEESVDAAPADIPPPHY